MFGYNPYYGRDGHYRAFAEEEAARRQYAAACAAEQQARQRAAQQSLLDNLYGGSYLPEDDYYPAGDYYAPRSTREQAYREALLERARQEDARRSALAAERERQQLYAQEMRRRQMLAEEQRRREAVERQRQLKLERERRRRRQSAEADADVSELERFYHAMGLPVPQRMPRSQEPAAQHASPIPMSARARTQPPTNRATEIPITTTAAPQEPSGAPQASAPATSSTEYTAEQNAAAAKIQEAYRTHATRKRALAQLSTISEAFASLRAGFRPPVQLDFQPSGSNSNIISVPTSDVPLPNTPTSTEAGDEYHTVLKLAYTSNNAPLHAYDEELNRLLGRLDAVASGGDPVVRDARRALVRTVETEAQRLERWRAAVWDAHLRPPVAAAPEATAETPASVAEADVVENMLEGVDDAATPANAEVDMVHEQLTGGADTSSETVLPLAPEPEAAAVAETSKPSVPENVTSDIPGPHESHITEQLSTIVTDADVVATSASPEVEMNDEEEPTFADALSGTVRPPTPESAASGAAPNTSSVDEEFVVVEHELVESPARPSEDDAPKTDDTDDVAPAAPSSAPTTVDTLQPSATTMDSGDPTDVFIASINSPPSTRGVPIAPGSPGTPLPPGTSLAVPSGATDGPLTDDGQVHAREYESTPALPLTNYLGSAHPVDASSGVAESVQQLVDTAGHAAAEREVHRGIGAEIQNVARMGHEREDVTAGVEGADERPHQQTGDHPPTASGRENDWRLVEA